MTLAVTWATFGSPPTLSNPLEAPPNFWKALDFRHPMGYLWESPDPYQIFTMVQNIDFLE